MSQTPATPEAKGPREPRGKNRIAGALALQLVRHLPWLLIGLALLAAALLFLPVFGKPIISLVETRHTSVSELLLAEIRSVCRLNTIEFHYRVVFPYDFLPPGVSAGSLLSKIQKNFGPGLEDSLSADEKLFVSALNLARRQGLNPYAPDFQFLVASVNIRAGLDFEAGEPQLQVLDRQVDGHALRRIQLTLPPARINAVEVQDPDHQNYPYPDLPLSPEGWKEIAAFVREHAIQRSLSDGLLAQAQANVESYLRPLLEQAGYEQVEFIKPGDAEQD